MYKDFKKTESLDTGFNSGGSLIWMFAGIVLGLLVGLGMYFFSNERLQRDSMIESLEKKIQQAQKTNEKPLSTEISPPQPARSAVNPQPHHGSELLRAEQKHQAQARQNQFSYYAVLPNLNVPVGSEKPINTEARVTASTVAQTTAQTETANQPINTIGASATEDRVSAAQEEAPKVANIGDFLLQVASFRKQSKADETRGYLNNQGIDAYIQKKKVKGRYWYRVVAGPVDQSNVATWKTTVEKLGHKPLVISVR